MLEKLFNLLLNLLNSKSKYIPKLIDLKDLLSLNNKLLLLKYLFDNL